VVKVTFHVGFPKEGVQEKAAEGAVALGGLNEGRQTQ
jgi:hypothetical protein